MIVDLFGNEIEETSKKKESKNKISQELFNFRVNMPLDMKIHYSKRRIIDFYRKTNGKCYCSNSGGKDSSVGDWLVYNAIKEDPFCRTIPPSYFVNTGLEYPEIVDYIDYRGYVNTVRPDRSFLDVTTNVGFPMVSKEVAMAIDRYNNTKCPIQKEYRQFGTREGVYIGTAGVVPKKYWNLLDVDFPISEKCCDILKKKPAHKITKKTGLYPIVFTMASESKLRRKKYLENGCNSFDGGNGPKSTPMSFWTDQDVLECIVKYNVPYCKDIYGDIILEGGVYRTTKEKRTGCVFCMFGIVMEYKTTGTHRFIRMEYSHPQLYKYCMDKLDIRGKLRLLNLPYCNAQLQPTLF